MKPIDVTERKSLKISVIHEIKKYITDNQLKAGDQLPTERNFMEMFGVSRSVIREALSYLENTEVIRVKQGQGAFLNESNITSLLDNYFFLWQINGGKLEDILSLRAIFETSAIDEILKENDKQSLEGLMRTVEDSRKATNQEEYREADVQFHKQLLTLTNNHLFIQLTNMITSYFFQVQHLQITAEKYAEIIKEHTEIVQALMEENSDKAKSLITHHIKKTDV
ncbi:FadR/GntR family transcriptional regulator [Gracilibacillus sp. HCP3S3_G5_1]|uniref:FadR/GntR family transcriptional regulator n=1 Tax=unclassified Gracilibacillus TaxID=2625209 RepID=UPI003F8C329E